MVLRVVFKECVVVFCRNGHGAWCWQICPIKVYMIKIDTVRCHHVARKLLDFGMSNSGSILLNCFEHDLAGLSKSRCPANRNNWQLEFPSWKHLVWIGCSTAQLLCRTCFQSVSQLNGWFLFFFFATCTRKSDFILSHLWEPILVQFGFHCHKELQIVIGGGDVRKKGCYTHESTYRFWEVHKKGWSSIRPVLHGLAISQSKFKRWNWPHRSSRVLTIKRPVKESNRYNTMPTAFRAHPSPLEPHQYTIHITSEKSKTEEWFQLAALLRMFWGTHLGYFCPT